MGKDKLKRFKENSTFSCMIQPEFEEYFKQDYPLKGCWSRSHFGNDHPVVLEIGCGRGEYTIELARRNPELNFIGIDIKGARMWRGAKTATEEKLSNVAFLRIRVEFINSFFKENEVSQIWITFPDPQLPVKRISKRLTSPQFLEKYARFLSHEGVIHLKTDSQHLHEYTKALLTINNIQSKVSSNDIYGSSLAEQDSRLQVKTAYEERFLEIGLQITYLCWQLRGKKHFNAPDFEPDKGDGTLDDNR